MIFHNKLNLKKVKEWEFSNCDILIFLNLMRNLQFPNYIITILFLALVFVSSCFEISIYIQL
jgi:hypothetical protein